jgi:hypothetical protein
MSSFDSFLAKYKPASPQAESKPTVPTTAQLPKKKKNPLLQMHEMQAGLKVPPKPAPPQTVDEAIQQATATQALKDAEPKPDFRGRLAKLDSLIADDLGLTITTIDSARNYVKEIMIQLKEEPELDSILIDRDVHNIIAVIRHIRIDAAAAMATGKEKSEKRVKKSTATSKGGKEIAAAFDDVDFSAFE